MAAVIRQFAFLSQPIRRVLPRTTLYAFNYPSFIRPFSSTMTIADSASNNEDISVTSFRRYLRVNTEQPKPDYEKCKEFLLEYAKELGIDAWAYECVPGKPFVCMTIPGSDPSLPSLLLYSHTDVVPTFAEKWKYNPYEGHKDENGDIYGRGAQDTKCLGIQYAEAYRRLKEQNNISYLRTVHILWGPDEEIAGIDGMCKFVTTDKFKEMNVGFALDESHASDTEEYVIHYGERCTWWLKVICSGQPGHGSRFIDDSAGEKFNTIISQFLKFRSEQYELMKSKNLKTGDVITINLTSVEGGVQLNVLPAELIAYFDIRVPPHVDFEEFEYQIGKWCAEAGVGVRYEFLQHRRSKMITPVTMDCPWWKEFETVMDEEGVKLSKEIAAGASDSKFLREVGVKAIGFSAINNTPILLHKNDEYVNEKVFVRGVELFTKLIPRLANIPKEEQ
jgi:aminoacylase